MYWTVPISTAESDRERRRSAPPPILVVVGLIVVAFLAQVGIKAYPVWRDILALNRMPKDVLMVEIACQHLDRVDAEDPATLHNLEEAKEYLEVAVITSEKWRPLSERTTALNDTPPDPLGPPLDAVRADCDSGIPEGEFRPLLPVEDESADEGAP